MFSVGSVPDIANAAQAPGFDKMRSGRDCRTVFRPLVFHPRCFSMRDFGVGRTKWNAVPAGVRRSGRCQAIAGTALRLVRPTDSTPIRRLDNAPWAFEFEDVTWTQVTRRTR